MKDKTTHTRNKIGGIEHYNGLGMSPRPTRTHQELLADTLGEFRKMLLKKGFSLVSEVELAGANSTAPDLVAFEVATGKPLAFVEIITSHWQKKDLAKAAETLAEYRLIEGFVFNYSTKKFFRITAKGIEKGVSKSSVLGIDFADSLS